VQTARVAEVAEKIANGYRKMTAIEPSIITSRPARGAHVI